MAMHGRGYGSQSTDPMMDLGALKDMTHDELTRRLGEVTEQLRRAAERRERASAHNVARGGPPMQPNQAERLAMIALRFYRAELDTRETAARETDGAVASEADRAHTLAESEAA